MIDLDKDAPIDTKSTQNRHIIDTKRHIIDTVCVCGKRHKTAHTYYRHRNSGKYNDKTGAGDCNTKCITNTITPTSPPLSSFQKKAEAAPVLQSVIQSNTVTELDKMKENTKAPIETMEDKAPIETMEDKAPIETMEDKAPIPPSTGIGHPLMFLLFFFAILISIVAFFVSKISGVNKNE